MLGPQGSQIYPDVHGIQHLLNYDLLNAGCCSILSHPKWGTAVYPATLFVKAPVQDLKRVLDEMRESDERN